MAAQIIIDQVAGQITIGGSAVLTGASSVTNPQASIVANSSTITSTDTYVTAAYLIAASTLAAGNRFRITMYGNYTPNNPGTDYMTFTVRFGTAGTTADTSILSATAAPTPTHNGIYYQFDVTVRTTGSSGTVLCNGNGISLNTDGVQLGSSTTINTTNALYLGLSVKNSSSADSLIVTMATVEQVH